MGIEFTNQFIMAGALLTLLCVFSSILSKRIGAPLLFLFLLLGMFAGEDGPGGIVFNDYQLAFLLGNLALAIIILDGGLGARKDTFRVSLKPALSLSSLGVLVTAGITGAATHWILDLPWQESLLLGAIVGSTDAAAVFGLISSAGLQLKERTRATLEVESGTNDPMAIFLTVTLVELLASNTSHLPGWTILLQLLQQMGLGLVIGLAGGMLLVALLKRLDLLASLYPLFVLAAGLSIFALTNILGGSGFLAIYLVGVITGNTPLPYGNDIHRLHDGIAWLSQITMFVVLGLLIKPSNLTPIILPALGIGLSLIFVARPVAVFLSLAPFRFPFREQLFISWCGLRGAVPIILALFPYLAGLERTNTFFELVFFIVLISLILQGWTIAPLARWLRIDLPHGQTDHALLSIPIPKHADAQLTLYEVMPGSKAQGLTPRAIPASSQNQLAGIIRQGRLLQTDDRTLFDPADQVVMFSTEKDLRIDQFFAQADQQQPNQSLDFFGEFSISPDASLKDLSLAYGFSLPEKYHGWTAAGYLQHKFHDKAVVGDRASLGQIQLVVKELQHGDIHLVGLKFKRQKKAAGK